MIETGVSTLSFSKTGSGARASPITSAPTGGASDQRGVSREASAAAKAIAKTGAM